MSGNAAAPVIRGDGVVVKTAVQNRIGFRPIV